MTDEQNERLRQEESTSTSNRTAMLFLLVLAVAAAFAAAKNTYDIKWALKNEMVLIQCK